MTRMTATANWHRGPWDATLYGLRYGGVRANNYGGCETLANGIQPSLGDPQCAVYTDHIKPWVIWSAAVGYRFDKRVKMTLNINNIFDKDAPVCVSCSLNGYDASNYDLPGRFTYVSANFRF